MYHLDHRFLISRLLHAKHFVARYGDDISLTRHGMCNNRVLSKRFDGFTTSSLYLPRIFYNRFDDRTHKLHDVYVRTRISRWELNLCYCCYFPPRTSLAV